MTTIQRVRPLVVAIIVGIMMTATITGVLIYLLKFAFPAEPAGTILNVRPNERAKPGIS